MDLLCNNVLHSRMSHFYENSERTSGRGERKREIGRKRKRVVTHSLQFHAKLRASASGGDYISIIYPQSFALISVLYSQIMFVQIFLGVYFVSLHTQELNFEI